MCCWTADSLCTTKLERKLILAFVKLVEDQEFMFQRLEWFPRLIVHGEGLHSNKNTSWEQSISSSHSAQMLDSSFTFIKNPLVFTSKSSAIKTCKLWICCINRRARNSNEIMLLFDGDLLDHFIGQFNGILWINRCIFHWETWPFFKIIYTFLS